MQLSSRLPQAAAADEDEKELGTHGALRRCARLQIACGADVEIHSLLRSPERNGMRRKAVEPGSGRWGVKSSDGWVLARESQDKS